MAKINKRNIALVLGMTIFDIGIGVYDRLINGIGVIRGLSSIALPAPVSTPISEVTVLNMTANSMSAFDFISMAAFVIIAVLVISLLAGLTCRAGGRM